MPNLLRKCAVAVPAAFLLAAGVATSASAAEPVAGCPTPTQLVTVDEAVLFFYDHGGTEDPATLVPFIAGIDTPGTDAAADDKSKGNGDGFVCIRESPAPNSTIQIGDNKVTLK
ncbi:hypothetical protein [Streptomyces sp. NPDC096030]|uniref:hypothetical protein n=1 Tax=Streptomyces sp. NPDC096030 TaxID=3155423 RepID=UPI003318A0DA